MSRSYPIYTKITACNYKSSKSFGSKNTSQQNIFVGTSASNSHELAEIVTTKREEGNNVIFKFSVDGIVLKEVIMCNKTKEIIEKHNYLKKTNIKMLISNTYSKENLQSYLNNRKPIIEEEERKAKRDY